MAEQPKEAKSEAPEDELLNASHRVQKMRKLLRLSRQWHQRKKLIEGKLSILLGKCGPLDCKQIQEYLGVEIKPDCTAEKLFTESVNFEQGQR